MLNDYVDRIAMALYRSGEGGEEQYTGEGDWHETVDACVRMLPGVRARSFQAHLDDPTSVELPAEYRL